MNEPIIYSIKEVETMLAARKCLGTVDWELPEDTLPPVRDTIGERSAKWLAYPSEPDTEMLFSVEPRFDTEVGAFSLTLHGRIKPTGWQAISRYDMHATSHENKAFCPGGVIEVPPGALHRHTYSEESMRRLGRWHSCAEILAIPKPIPIPSERRLFLKRIFLDGMRIQLVDADAYRAMMEIDQK
jgi:hypothetical protein